MNIRDEKIRVSAVKYINSYPFMIGLRDSEVAAMIDLGVRLSIGVCQQAH